MAVTILTANAGNATTQQGYSHHGGLVMPMHHWTSSPPVGIHFFSSFSSVCSATLIPQTQLLWKTVILFFYAYFFLIMTMFLSLYTYENFFTRYFSTPAGKYIQFNTSSSIHHYASRVCLITTKNILKYNLSNNASVL